MSAKLESRLSVVKKSFVCFDTVQELLVLLSVGRSSLESEDSLALLLVGPNRIGT